MKKQTLIPIACTLILLVAGCSLPTGGGGENEGGIPVPPAELRTGQQAGSTFYIRPDGGTYEQCTGQVDAPYPGSGIDQDCAWDHPFRVLPPDGNPALIQGGDTLIIASGSYMMGYGAPGADNCEYEASYECNLTPIPSGPDAQHPTRILGAGWDSGCMDAPELWGTGRPWNVIDLTGSSNIEVACLELTDHSSCIEDHVFVTGGSEYTCQRDAPPYGDWAANGLYAEDSANVLLKDLNIHGLANTGILAGRLTDWTVENVQLVGNGLAGWNGDLVGDSSNSENHGTFTFRHWLVSWNGCGETWPGLENVACWGQEAGGYGDGAGFGGTTGGHYIIEDSAFLNNTSDGLDMLYLRLPDASVEIRRTTFEGNDGNQVKMSGSEVILENNLIVSNCGFFHGMGFWNNDDDCRAGGDALAIFLQPGGTASVINTTITGEGNCLVVAGCALDKTCNGRESILMRNVLFQGQKVYWDQGTDTCFAWYDDESSPPMPKNPFTVEYSLINSVRYGNVTPCPGDANLCDIPSGVTDRDINQFDARLSAGSAAINSGSPDGVPAEDITGRARDSQPDIGAYER